jgi:acetylornithine deacetylase/succinyl-diaminopimelate desuccinylase-like protein
MRKESSNNDLTAIREVIKKKETYYLELLREGLKASFSNLEGFQSWIAERMRQMSLQVDEFTVDREELAHQPAYQKTLRENPSALRFGPNIVGRLTGQGVGRGTLLYAHPDKFPETFDWGRKHPDMVERDGRLFAPGIADDVAGVTAILGAVETFRRLGFEPRGDLMVASPLGKQLSVCGTYGLVTRYGPMDAAIYVHPRENGGALDDIHTTSSGVIEFLIQIHVQAPETTDQFQARYSRSTIRAVEKGVYLLQGLHEWAAEASKRYRHVGLEELIGQTVALLVSTLTAGKGTSAAYGTENEGYGIPLRCVLEGMVCFPPGASLDTVQADFKETFARLVTQDPGLAQSHVQLEWGDMIGDSAEVDEESSLRQITRQVITEVTGREAYYYYGHSLSDTRYPMLYWNAPAIGVGPLCGDIGTEGEWVDRKDYLDTIVAVTLMLREIA